MPVEDAFIVQAEGVKHGDKEFSKSSCLSETEE